MCWNDDIAFVRNELRVYEEAYKKDKAEDFTQEKFIESIGTNMKYAEEAWKDVRRLAKL